MHSCKSWKSQEWHRSGSRSTSGHLQYEKQCHWALLFFKVASEGHDASIAAPSSHGGRQEWRCSDAKSTSQGLCTHHQPFQNTTPNCTHLLVAVIIGLPFIAPLRSNLPYVDLEWRGLVQGGRDGVQPARPVGGCAAIGRPRALSPACPAATAAALSIHPQYLPGARCLPVYSRS